MVWRDPDFIYPVFPHIDMLCLHGHYVISMVGENEYDYRNKTYFESNEQSLKERFLKDLKNQDQSFWLWESLRQDETPALLGYTIGYRICESYYLRAVDKNQALLDILAITDDQAFLKASGYFEPSN